MARAVECAQVSYAAPDLEEAERFLTAFGFARIPESTDEVLYMRGTNDQHHIHVTHLAEKQRFLGATIEVESRADLEELAALEGSSEITESEEPGGGQVVLMHTPDGIPIRAIHGRAKAEPLEDREPFRFNNLSDKQRVGDSVRIKQGPCTVNRLGHFVLHVSNHDETVAWFKERFNFLDSDYFVPPGEEGPIVGTFLRLDRGDELVDHHFMLVLQSDWVGVHHSAFEVLDLDAVMSAHDHLIAEGFTSDVGVGRHLLGSQIFDYWKDPFGFRIEHYTDGDVVNADHVPTRFNGTASDTTQWGNRPPLEFFQ
ncbi:VOC family protein [Corynebacterium comes]|uniref:Glyoxalase/Bleomycin resistance protein/Dioxygenase superfamily protein n=1 Tax=Corynebacterium comes TaxID=2675218 RepID=A0A6B8VDQ4_9CORY|nr:VOC family protein [Corynebacterium comes]QGU03362.1 Glyoxalase/Bleomycin resistance protein/Dioxygenase superfamily protein [Corynebacterium comes]